MTNVNTPNTPAEKKSKKKTYIIAAIAAVVVIGGCNAIINGTEDPTTTAPEETTTVAKETPKQEKAPEPKTVKAGDSEFTCKDVPQDTMDSIMQGDKNSDGANAEVLESQMVEGTSGAIFVAAKIEWNGDGNPFQATFGVTDGGEGSIVSASKGTAMLFNWPYLEDAAKSDAAIAVKQCL